MPSWLQATDTQSNRKYLVLTIYAIFYQYLCNIKKFYAETVFNTLQGTLNKEEKEKYVKSLNKSLEQFDNYIKVCLINHFKIFGYSNFESCFHVTPPNDYTFITSTNRMFYFDPDITINSAENCDPSKYLLAYNGSEFQKGETIERLTKFLISARGKMVIPKTNDVIAVGAPIQNDYIYRCTVQELEGYYRALTDSRKIYVKYFKNKIDVMKSGIPASTAINYKDKIYALLKNIQGSSQIAKQAKCTEMVLAVAQEYRDLKTKEFELGGQEAILRVRGKVALKNINKEISSDERESVNIERMCAGVQAYAFRIITDLTFKLFIKHLQLYRETSKICPDLQEHISKQFGIIDEEIKDKVTKQVAINLQELEAKYGTLLGGNKLSIPSGVSSIPAPPPEYAQYIAQALSKPGAPGAPGALVGMPATGTNRRFVPTPKMLQIATSAFWQKVKAALGGMTIFIIVGNKDFASSDIYFVDLVASMISGRIYKIEMSFSSAAEFRERITRRGYLLLASTVSDINNPGRWRFMTKNKLAYMLRSRNIGKIRLSVFNLIANTLFYDEHTNNALPESSKISRRLRRTCENMRVQLANCNFIISRAQLASGLQNATAKFPELQGIDFVSGSAYAEHNPEREQAESNVFRRGIKGGNKKKKNK